MLAACVVLSAAGAAFADELTLSWNRSPEPNVTAYRVFVGTAPGVFDTTFDLPASQTRFVFGAAFRGLRYYFSVAAQAGDAEWSDRSEEVSEVAGASTTRDAGVRVELSALQPVLNALRPDDAVASVTVAQSLRQVTALGVSAEGVGLVVEDRRVLRTFDARGLLAEPAIELDDDTTVEDVALAPDFEQTGHVLLALSRTVRGGGREVVLERHRLLAGALGEGAVVAQGIGARENAHAAVAMAADGRMFVTQSGALAAFAATGAPIAPSRATGTLGGDGELSPSVLHLAADDTLWVAWRGQPGSAEVRRLAADGGTASAGFDVPGTARPTLVVIDGRLVLATPVAGALRLTDVANGAAADIAVPLPSDAEPVLAVPGRAGWFVVVRERSSNGTPTDSLLFVSPVAARR